jgi:hypothetical protein
LFSVPDYLESWDTCNTDLAALLRSLTLKSIIQDLFILLPGVSGSTLSERSGYAARLYVLQAESL